jgi:6-pyruvoyltetrahydropterin/6-carboxytetrahydropterin synthase
MIHLTREVRFSVDRDWAGRIEFSRPVTNSWGGWPSAVGLVAYLRLRATVAGEPDPVTGYLCNIALLDRLLREHAIPYAAEQLQRRGWRVPAEQLLAAVWREVETRTPPGAELTRLELLATPHLHYTIEREKPTMVLLTQQFEFSAAHRLHCPELSDAENSRIFGKCNNASGHGHNYLLDVTVAGEPDAATGALISLPKLEQIVQEFVIEPLDHKHLNHDVGQFRTLNPSVENIARVIWGMLAPHLPPPARLHRVRVFETPKTWAEYGGP